MVEMCISRMCRLALMTVLVLTSSSYVNGSAMRPVNPSYGKEVPSSCNYFIYWCIEECPYWRNFTSFPFMLNKASSAPSPYQTETCQAEITNYVARLTNITVLFQGGNHIIPRNVTAMLKELRYWYLFGNSNLTPEYLREMFSLPTLTRVGIQNCAINSLPKGLFENIKSNIEAIDLEYNTNDATYNLDAFCDLQFLLSLRLAGSEIRQIRSSCPLKELDFLDLAINAFVTFPNTCSLASNESIFPALRTLILRQNQIKFLSSIEICLPSLENLDLSSNIITVFPAFAFDSLKFPRLKTLFLKRQAEYVSAFRSSKYVIANNAFHNYNLEVLELSKNGLEFADRRRIDKNAFANCSGLKSLGLNFSNFTYVDDRRFLELFGHLRSLNKLSLSACQLESVSPRTFAPFRNLTNLLLDHNRIADLPDGAFDSLVRLKRLCLHNNKINNVNQHTFGKHLQENLSELTLSFNPFLCSCDLLWFARWYQSDQSKLFKDASSPIDYTCQNIAQTPLSNFSMTEQACLLNRATNVLLIQFCGVFISALTLVSLVFRYHWHIRLLMYEVFRGRDVLRRQRLQANDFDFDVFVCYASEDLLWVRQQLMAKLEDDLGLRLCVHDRDFLPGRHIADNIVQSVNRSKKILMVFSTHFVRSQWCQFELSLCLTHVLDYDDVMIVVCVDDVTSRQMTSTMRAVVKTTTYMQWRAEDEDAVRSFWERFRQCLHEILPRDEHFV